MDSGSSEKISETFLSRLTKHRVGAEISDLKALKSRLLDDLKINDDEFAGIVSAAQSKKIIKIQNDAEPFLSITDDKAIGVQRLMRKFCKRYYGEVSPLIDRKTIQAVLRRHGANFDLDDQTVRAELQILSDEGLIRIIDREDAFLKLLGAE